MIRDRASHSPSS
ncbi:hypothetical protein D046_6679A, partial [Vibrio parahaemolyticus V-223/04]